MHLNTAIPPARGGADRGVTDCTGHGGYTGTELGQGVQANSHTRDSVWGVSRSVNEGLQCHAASLSLCTCLGLLHLH